MKNHKFAPPLDQKSYAECFAAYKKISTEWDSINNWIQKNLLKNLSKRNNISVLGVGSGIGDFDMELIHYLRSKFEILNYVAIEPNEMLIQQFKSRIKNASLENVTLQIHPMPFEEFKTEKCFDLVHLTHCLYYIPNRERMIMHALDLILDDGLVLIFNNMPQGINQIQQKFLKKIKGDEKEMFSGKQLLKVLDKYQISYCFEVIDSFLDVSECFKTVSELCQRITNFFLECDIQKLPLETKEEILTFIRRLSIYNQGRRVIFHPVGIFSLFKK